jgi:hypothetical protein
MFEIFPSVFVPEFPSAMEPVVEDLAVLHGRALEGVHTLSQIAKASSLIDVTSSQNWICCNIRLK